MKKGEEAEIPLTTREQVLLGQAPPVSKRMFVERLWSLNPRGNPEEAYIEVCRKVSFERTFMGNPVTLDLIVEKYSAYLAMKEAEHSEQRYIKGIAKFTSDHGFNMDFGERKNSRFDVYDDRPGK